MPSRSLQEWNTTRTSKLGEIEAAHHSIGGLARGRRYATEQINHAYTMLLASQFQGFCRDFHSECAYHIVRAVTPLVLQRVLLGEFRLNRSLDRGNANPGAIGADFNRLDVDFWNQIYADYQGNDRRRELLDNLNAWRNAIAHQDFDPTKLGGTTTLHLARVRRWRRICNRLAQSFDDVMQRHITALTGNSPW
jgi:hypothetical protein